MTERPPADRPGHLDSDAVSAFVDRDLTADDLAILAFHLHECPACHREVLEIRTTVVLLAGLPQYTPRRSFCLGHEHARAARRRGASAGPTWPASGSPDPGRYPAPAMAAVSGASWLPGLQVAAMMVGVILLLVTSSDLMGMPPQPAAWLAGSDGGAPQAEQFAAPVVETAPPPAAPAMKAADDAGLQAAAPAPEAVSEFAGQETGGTTSDENTSEEVLTSAAQATMAPGYATNAALAVVPRAAPTAQAGLARTSDTATETERTAAPAASEPSRLRLVQIALAFALAWLVVSIVGLRWVRGLR
ncbi:MAG: zf-HC2 domain-containing protein [Chloroflexota bacterium]|nr:zf-HC2 domain-containing protein [Chloroflexota bacterium]